MDKTQTTLLARLCDRSDQAAWRTFDELYRPLMWSYARARGLDAADADDIVQQCVTAVLEQIEHYQHRASFKSWLRAIVEHKIIDLIRSRRREVPAGSDVQRVAADTTGSPDELWDRQWSLAHLRHCAEIVRREVAKSTYAAFAGYALEGRDAAAVAAELKLTVNQVYVAKHRVVERIRALMLELSGEAEIGL